MEKNDIILNDRIIYYSNVLKNDFEATLKTIQDKDVDKKTGQLIKNEIERIDGILNGNVDIVDFKKIDNHNSNSHLTNIIKGNLRDTRSAISDAYKNGTRNFNLNFEKDLYIYAWARAYEDFLNYLKEKLPQKDNNNKPKYDTIESIFQEPKNIQKVIDFLIDYETLNKKGKLIEPKYHILAITEALVMNGIINKDVSKTQRNKLFAKKLNENISEKTTRAKSKLHSELVTGYKELFDTLK